MKNTTNYDRPDERAKIVHRRKEIVHTKAIPVEERLSKEELARLHNAIHFTHQVMWKESMEKMDE